jgi:hypothetical protein
MEDSVARDLLVSLLEKGIGIHNAEHPYLIKGPSDS